MKYIIGILLFLTVTACNDPQNAPDPQTTGTPESNSGDTAENRFTRLLYDYYLVKNALVKDNAVDADAATRSLISTTNRLRTYPPDSAVNIETATHLDTITYYGTRLLEMKDETCEYKRIPFEKISDAMYVLIKKKGVKNTIVYRQYCPMAFNDKGAYWLSNEAEINNPYFGKKMKECGEITETIK